MPRRDSLGRIPDSLTRGIVVEPTIVPMNIHTRLWRSREGSNEDKRLVGDVERS